ncbi:MAG: hypothetical protein P4L53_16095 [Candidatus Obscuribacterales bacterium]|nr:hypothetical protein [Candidatus Obscuribacterales bacterium]
MRLKLGLRSAFSMRHRKNLIAILSFALCLFAAALPALAEDAGWVLTQRSARLGDQYLYISEHGVKLVNPKLGLVIICRSPGMELYVCNDSTHNYYETTAEVWKHQSIARQGSTDFSGTTGWHPTGRATIAGLPTIIYTLDGTWVKRRANGGVVVSDTKGASYCLAQGIRVPAKLSELLSAALGVPNMPGVPVRLALNENGGIRSVLDTYRCDRTPLTAAYFAKPLGYRKVATDAEVMLSSEDDKMIQDMAHSLGNSSTDSDALAKAAAKYTKGGAGPTPDEIKSAIEAYKRNQGH